MRLAPPGPGACGSATPRVLLPWAIIAALTGGNLFLHKPFSDLCDALFARIGRGAYERWTLLAIAAISLAGATFLLRRRLTALLRPRAALAAAALALITVAAQRWLLVSNIEMIHLPQFGLLAALMLWGGAGPRGSFLGATLAGVLDEAYQRLVIYAALPSVYFDWNDVVLNAIGAAWAALLGARAAAPVARAASAARRAAALAACGALLLAAWLAPPRLAARATFPFWQPELVRAATGFDYHVMSASEALAALLMLWLLVHLATGGAARRAAGAAAGVALCLLAAGCAARGAAPSPMPPSPAAAPPSPAPAAGEAAPQPFIVTLWCGPPLGLFDDRRAAEIAAAGFTVAGAPCEGAITTALNRRALDVAARHGLRMWIAEPGINPYHGLAADWQARMDAAALAYGDHPALAGYFIVDEPSAEQFADLGQVVARLRAVDPRRLAYINLPPDFVRPELLGTETYRDYVDAYMRVVQPSLLSYDHYPFKQSSDRESYFANLELVRDTARAHGIPFLVVVQAMPHGPYRDPSEAEIAWQVHHALAFGARGISYFAYWTPVRVDHAARWRFRHGLIEDGQPTEHYAQAARINATARAIAAQLDGWHSLAVVDTQGRFGVALPIGPLTGIAGGRVTAGLFRDGAGGLAALLVNQDYRGPTEARLQLRAGTAPRVFDPARAEWHALPDAAVFLPPGGAVLLRL